MLYKEEDIRAITYSHIKDLHDGGATEVGDPDEVDKRWTSLARDKAVYCKVGVSAAFEICYSTSNVMSWQMWCAEHQLCPAFGVVLVYLVC
jgi:hypothetical protein